jgi:hypothetical protein
MVFGIGSMKTPSLHSTTFVDGSSIENHVGVDHVE